MARTNTRQRNPSPSRQRLSMTAENYLLSIYRLQEEDITVTLTQLAEHLKMLPKGEGLGTSLPTVGGMIRRLEREGLIEMDSRKQVALTRKGTQDAESMHKRAERFKRLTRLDAMPRRNS